MIYFLRLLSAGVLFIAAGCVCSGSPVQEGPPAQEIGGAPVAAPGEQGGRGGGADGAGKYRNLFPDVVATVNGAPVSGRDLETAVSREMASMGNPEWKSLREEYRGDLVYNLVTNLINTKLLYAEAVAGGIFISDSEVQDEYLKVAGRFKNDKEMKAYMAGQNIDNDQMIRDIHSAMVISKYIDEAIRSGIMVTEGEMEKFYSENPDQFRYPDLVRTSHIMIAAGKNQKEEALAKQRIDDLMARVGRGEDFAALAREHSMSPSASQGGDIGYSARDNLPAEYADAAFSLPVGDARVVKTQEGHFIVKVTGKKKAGTASLDESKERLAEFLLNEKIQGALHKKINQLRDAAEIEILIPAGAPLEP
ncbi:MAG: peptidylprolyl isomerase [Acidobacteria bacterium]|nr:peptidylprolyl isomerase [Acidobacteriota bacterium]